MKKLNLLNIFKRKIIPTLVIVIIIVGMIYFFQAINLKENRKAQMDPRIFAQTTLNIKGVETVFDAYKLKRELKKLAGVISVDIDRDKNKLSVQYKREQVTTKKIIEKVSKTGYEAELLPGASKIEVLKFNMTFQ